MHAYTVKVRRSQPPHYYNLDNFFFTVAAENAHDAIKKAIRKAKQDSGFKRVWQCVFLERGGEIVS